MGTFIDDRLQVLSWREIRDEVAEKNPEFAEYANQYNPKGDYKVYRASYPFGSYIIKNGVFYLPYKNALLPFKDPALPEVLREELHYNFNTAPLSIIFKHLVELSIQTENRLVPFTVRPEGSIYALTGILDQERSFSYHNAWSMTAGAKNIFILPKVKDFYSYKKLCRARGIVRLGLPANLLEQQNLLAQMSQDPNFPKWDCEILLFPVMWLKKREDPAWYRFQYFLYKEAWSKSGYWRNTFLFDMTWDSFIAESVRRRIRIVPQAANVVKHLFAIALGAVPGFVPAVDDRLGPIKAFQKDFYEIYGLDRYVATMLVPQHFSMEKPEEPVYWSLHLPNYFQSTPQPKAEKTTLTLMHEAIEVLEHFIEMGLQGDILGVAGTPVYDMLKHVKFDFFHSEADSYGAVRPVRDMAGEDKRLLFCPPQYGVREFSEMGPFVRGCVRIGGGKSTKPPNFIPAAS